MEEQISRQDLTKARQKTSRGKKLNPVTPCLASGALDDIVWVPAVLGIPALQTSSLVSLRDLLGWLHLVPAAFFGEHLIVSVMPIVLG